MRDAWAKWSGSTGAGTTPMWARTRCILPAQYEYMCTYYTVMVYSGVVTRAQCEVSAIRNDPSRRHHNSKLVGWHSLTGIPTFLQRLTSTLFAFDLKVPNIDSSLASLKAGFSFEPDLLWGPICTFAIYC